MNQLRDGMRQGYFENNVSLDIQREDQDNHQRLFSSRQNNVAALLEEDHYGSDQELIGGTRAMRERIDARLGNARRTLTRNDDLPEEVDNSEQDEDFDAEMSNQQSNQEDDDDDDDFASIQSEVNDGNRIRGENRNTSQTLIRRDNYHDPASRRIRQTAVL